MRIAILGNSGSGKSTLAHKLSLEKGAAVLDLDTIYWQQNVIAVKRSVAAARDDLDRFCSRDGWIVEGCYGDLIERAFHWRPELIFLNPGKSVCLANCSNRPWEPHKYASQGEQDSRAEALLSWVSEYYTRDGEMSFARHRELFIAYDGPKREITQQE